MFREDGEDRRACVMRFRGGGYSVGIVEHIPSGQHPFDPRRRGLDHLAFAVGSRAELELWAQRRPARASNTLASLRSHRVPS